MAKSKSKQVCAGCGAEAARHPMIMVGREDMEHDAGPMVDYPICDACWREPSHRSNQLKGHFFDRLDRERALDGARRQVLLTDRSNLPEGLSPEDYES